MTPFFVVKTSICLELILGPRLYIIDSKTHSIFEGIWSQRSRTFTLIVDKETRNLLMFFVTYRVDMKTSSVTDHVIVHKLLFISKGWGKVLKAGKGVVDVLFG